MNLLNELNDSKFVARNWNVVIDQLNANYSTGNEIVYSTVSLESNLFDYSGTYILGRSHITIIGLNVFTEVAFKN